MKVWARLEQRFFSALFFLLLSFPSQQQQMELIGFSLFGPNQPWTGLLSPSRICSEFTGLSGALRLLLDFPSRLGRETDMDATGGLLLHFNTDGNSSTDSSAAGNSSCGGREQIRRIKHAFVKGRQQKLLFIS